MKQAKKSLTLGEANQGYNKGIKLLTTKASCSIDETIIGAV